MGVPLHELSTSDVSPDSLGVALDRLIEDLDKNFEHDLFHRSDTSNFVVCLSKRDVTNERRELISLLCRLVAGRIFVILVDEDSSEKLNIDVTAQCHHTTTGEYLCAELIEVVVGRDSLVRIPSLVYANALVGFPVDVIFLGDTIPSLCLDSILPLAERVFFHGAQMSGRTSQLRRLLSHTDQLVDLLWIQLSGWRGELKEVFSSQRLIQILPALSRIHLSFGTRGSYGALSCLYLAGWILDRLHLDVVAVGSRYFECRLPSGGMVELICEHRSDKNADFLALQFGAQDNEYVRISHDRFFETQISLAGITRTTHNEHDSNSVTHCLENYFLVGESVVNYRGAIERALELQSLRSGFQG
ncbi:MAG: glucose-6-phosphate dehydrogenase assembly protein OpcA [Bdellovibrionales bacterium]|nr:glucose-6-phosphate dehydrogenase assembly protein OpcA [Bdellovibrionales bacterium]